MNAKRYSKKEIISLLTKAIEKQNKFQEDIKPGISNPQVNEMYLIAKGRTEALDAVISAMNGDHFYLKILGE